MKKRRQSSSYGSRWKSFQVAGVICLIAFLLSCAPQILAQIIVKGRVLGADAQPMRMASVSLTLPEEIHAQRTVQAHESGEFSITIDSAGLWILHFTGVGFRDHRVAVYVDKPQTIEINVRLGGYRYLSDFGRVTVVGDFNRWFVLSAVPMKKRTDGTYTAMVKTAVDTLAYQLNQVRDGYAVEGTQADRYVFDASRGYISVMDVKPGIVKIIFDPRKLFRHSTWATVHFEHATSIVPQFASIYDELQRDQEEFVTSQRNFLRSGRSHQDFKYDWSGPLSSFEKQIKETKVRVLREELWLSRVMIAMTAGRMNDSLCDATLHEIAPSSSVWSLNAHSLFFLLAHSGWTEAQCDEFVQQTLRTNRDEGVKVALVYDLYMAAKLSSQGQKAKRYKDLLLTRYGRTPEAAQVKQQGY